MEERSSGFITDYNNDELFKWYRTLKDLNFVWNHLLSMGHHEIKENFVGLKKELFNIVYPSISNAGIYKEDNYSKDICINKWINYSLDQETAPMIKFRTKFINPV